VLRGAPAIVDVLELAGVKSACAKIFGSHRRNPYVVMQALFDAFNHHLSPEEEAAKRGALATARAIYEHALAAFPAKKGVWLAAARLEAERGSRDSLEALLRRAVAHCPRAEVLWLMGAKAAWRAGDVAGARAVLEGAFAANPDSEDILLAAFKLEFESGERERARRIAARARDAVRSARVWQKSAQVEREEGDAAAEARLLDDGLARFPGAHKLWLMRAQLEERLGRGEGARTVYARALRACVKCTSSSSVSPNTMSTFLFGGTSTPQNSSRSWKVMPSMSSTPP
jgi:Tfp pilus assembly protein PilF